MPKNATRKLLESHLVSGELVPGREIAIEIDQTLTQDATGTLVMLELEALGLDRVKTQLSAQYVDHNLIQADHRNPDDHLFLESACRRFGVQFSPAGNGVSHPVHQELFGTPGQSLLGSDSHTCAAGGIGMLAIGTGGLEVALAMAGMPFDLRCPEVMGVRLTGRLPEWVSAKDLVLEMLRRHGVRGGLGRVIEYHGPGVETLTAMDRHVVANMGAELGATTTVFPSDGMTRAFLDRFGRGKDWVELVADEGAEYDHEDEIDLSALEPLIALPSSPGNVVPVREVAGRDLYQVYIGSSANPGFRDFAIAAEIVKGERVPAEVSLDVNPTSRRLLLDLVASGHLKDLIDAGARLHQAGCNGCIGMGQAPATGRNSLRTVPRNFPGRSGTREDAVYLCSPETAAASAIRGVITDPRELERAYPDVREPPPSTYPPGPVEAPPPPEEAREVELVKGPNVSSLPELEPLAEAAELPVVLVVGDDVSTDEILPAGTRVLPFRSNIERIAEFSFGPIDEEYPARARTAREEEGGHVVVGGWNYGQGSSREHAALAPRSLGLRAVIARSFARIHRGNLINFGVLPLIADDEVTLDQGERVRVPAPRELPGADERFELESASGDGKVPVHHDLSPREREVLEAGGRIAWARGRL